MGIMDAVRKKRFWNSIDRQIKTKEAEREKAQSNESIAPPSIAGYSKKYHYKDVSVGVVWQYGGHYGKTLQDIGVKRGDRLHLIPEPSEENDRDVSIYHDNIKIGYMYRNRMAAMVYAWSKRNLPIFAVVNSLGKEQRLIIEVAFYGSHNKKTKPGNEE